jgi:mannose-6-phosphate isomerase-like protein (cupin superfamily)
MEPILVEMEAGGDTGEDDPHEGEEFGYVLAGAVQIALGERVVRARKGESFYFRPTEPHRLTNPGKTTARFLWVSTPPSF